MIRNYLQLYYKLTTIISYLHFIVILFILVLLYSILESGICVVDVWRMFGDRFPVIGMSAAYCMAENRHPRNRVWLTLYLKAETSSIHLTHLRHNVSPSMVIYLYSRASNLQPTIYYIFCLFIVYYFCILYLVYNSYKSKKYFFICLKGALFYYIHK